MHQPVEPAPEPLENLPLSSWGLLCSIHGKVGAIERDVVHIKTRQTAIESTLWKLETERVERDGFKKGVTRYFTIGRAIWAAGLGTLLWAAWTHLAPLLPRV